MRAASFPFFLTLFSFFFLPLCVRLGPSSPPILEMTVEGDSLRSTNGHAFARAGQSIRVVCTSGGGQPEPDLNLYRNGIPVPGVHPRKKENSLTFVVGKEDNSIVWQCRAANSLATVSSNEIVLNVLCKLFGLPFYLETNHKFFGLVLYFTATLPKYVFS